MGTCGAKQMFVRRQHFWPVQLSQENADTGSVHEKLLQPVPSPLMWEFKALDIGIRLDNQRGTGPCFTRRQISKISRFSHHFSWHSRRGSGGNETTGALREVEGWDCVA